MLRGGHVWRTLGFGAASVDSSRQLQLTRVKLGLVVALGRVTLLAYRVRPGSHGSADGMDSPIFCCEEE